MAMEDPNVLVGDCIVICCCCCECLVLQIVVFLLLDLPCKVARKTREYARKKLQRHTRKGRRRGEEGNAGFEDMYCASEGEVLGSFGLIQLELELELDGSPFNGELCMEEVDKVLEELSLEGEFAFGSFWGRDFTRRSCDDFVHPRLSEVAAGPSNWY